MKLLLLFLAFGVLLTVEARKKRPVESAEEDVPEEAVEVPAAPEDSGDDADDGEVEAEPKSDAGSSCKKLGDQKDVAKARERTCYELLKQIKKQAKKNERPTPKQKEIKDECLDKYSEEFLESGYGGIRKNIKNPFKNYPSTYVKKVIRNSQDIPCAKDDKIIDFGVGWVRGKY